MPDPIIVDASWTAIFKQLVLQLIPLLFGWLGHMLGARTAKGNGVPTSTDEARNQARK